MWYTFDNNDLILRLRIQPKASSNELAEILGDERKLRITAPPVDGKANKHIIALLAKMCKVAKGDVTIESIALTAWCRYDPAKQVQPLKGLNAIPFIPFIPVLMSSP